MLKTKFPITYLQDFNEPSKHAYIHILATHKTVILDSDLENVWKINIKIKIISEKVAYFSM